MIDESFLVLPNTSFELVNEPVDRRIHVFFGVIAVDLATVDACGCLGFVPEFLDGQDTMDVRHDVKVAPDCSMPWSLPIRMIMPTTRLTWMSSILWAN